MRLGSCYPAIVLPRASSLKICCTQHQSNPSPNPMRNNPHQRWPKRAFRVPEVKRLLHPQPQPRPVAAPFAEAHRHFGRYGCGSGDNLVKCLARYTQLARGLCNGQAERGEDIFLEQFTGMGGAALFTHRGLPAHPPPWVAHRLVCQ